MLSYDEKLVYSANQIAHFFKAQGEPKAIPAIADHINKFWDPRMREDFLLFVQTPEAKLHELVRRALPLVRSPAKA